MTRVDRAFARFRESGDARALGVVFDATANELFRFAWHLTGDRHAAEDLVQTTFLTAIEAAASFTAGERVVPWLVGILANRAREARRRARQRRAPPAAIAAERAVDPVEEVMARELGDTVRDQLRALDAPYREVLVLHVEQGLGAKEIAKSLGRPAATVRSQILRGLERLRRALPASLATGARACAPVPLLDGVRVTVLARAGDGLSAAVAAPPFAVLGALLMKKSVVIPVSLLLACVLTCPLWSSLLTRGSVDPSVAGPGAMPPGPASAPGPNETPGPRLPPAERAQDKAARPPALAVHVRFAADGEPALDAEVIVQPGTHDSELRERRARTDATGTARFAQLPAGPLAVRADRAGGWTTTELTDDVPARVEITIPAGVTFSGRVVDSNGQPIAGASIWLSMQRWSVNWGAVAARSDDEGKFTLRAVEPGRLLGAWAEGFPPSEIRDVTMAMDGQSAVTLRLWPAAGRIEGVVRGPDGALLENAAVLVGLAGAPGLTRAGNQPIGNPPRFLRTDGQGRFRATSSPGSTPLWVRAPDCCVWIEPIDVRADGPTRIDVRLQPATTLTGRIVDANGKPLPRVNVRALHPAVEPKPGMAWQGPPWAHFVTGTDAAGCYALSGMPAGDVRLLATKDKLAAATTLRFVPGDRLEWNVVLGAGPSIQGVVVDSRGKPLPGYEVSADTKSNPRRLGPVETDAAGGFTLAGAIEDGDGYRVQVRAKDCELPGWLAEVSSVRPGTSGLRVVLADDRVPSATITGVVVGPSGAPLEDVTVLLQQAGADGCMFAGGNTFKLAAGRFTTKPVPPGRYEVLLNAAALGQHSLGIREVAAGTTHDLGRVRYEPPGGLEVEVIGTDGKPVTLLLKLRHQDERFGSGLPAFGGRAAWKLQPGRYVLATVGEAMALREVEVASGRIEKVRLELAAGVKRRVRLPAIPRHDFYRIERWRDSQGRLVCEWGGTWPQSSQPTEVTRTIAPGHYTVEVQDASGASKSIEVTVDERPESATAIELPLPARSP